VPQHNVIDVWVSLQKGSIYFYNGKTKSNPFPKPEYHQCTGCISRVCVCESGGGGMCVLCVLGKFLR